MSDARLKRFLLVSLSAAAAAALFYVSVKYLLAWLLPFLLALSAAAAVEPAVRFLQARLGLRRGFSSLLLTLFILFIFGGLASLLVSSLLGEADSLLARIPELLAASEAAISGLAGRLRQSGAQCPPWFRERVEDALSRLASETGSLLSSLALRLPGVLAGIAAAVPRLFLGAITTVLAIYFTSSSLPDLKRFVSEHVPAKRLQTLRLVRSRLSRSLMGWLRAELTLCAVTFAELLAGFMLLRQPYALLAAFLITLVDALPVFGTGTVLIPWFVTELLFQNIPKSIFLAALYLLTLVVRNALEPRLLGAQAGLPPIASLFAMYLGFCTLGIAGMVLLPFLLLLAAQLYGQKNSRQGV